MSRIIPSEQFNSYRTDEVPVMRVPVAELSHDGSGAVAPLITAHHLDKLQKQAYAEGFALGHQEGVSAGQADTRAHVQRLDQMMRALSKPFENLDEQVEQEILLLTFALVRQLVRREIKMDPGQIVAVVREAMASLPTASRNARLYLHPDDAALVRDALSLGEGERPWRVMEDPVLTRGGCRVVTDTSQIDAGVETRLATLIATALGGERERDSQSS